MSDPLVIQTLTAKRAEILGQIKAYGAQIAHANYDLAHLNATMELFAAPERQRARCLVGHRVFKVGRDRGHLCPAFGRRWRDDDAGAG